MRFGYLFNMLGDFHMCVSYNYFLSRMYDAYKIRNQHNSIACIMNNSLKYNAHVRNIGNSHQLDLIRVDHYWNTMQNNKRYSYIEDWEDSATCMHKSAGCSLRYSRQLLQLSGKFALLEILVQFAWKLSQKMRLSLPAPPDNCRTEYRSTNDQTRP